jgi:hypothetical protein
MRSRIVELYLHLPMCLHGIFFFSFSSSSSFFFFFFFFFLFFFYPCLSTWSIGLP